MMLGRLDKRAAIYRLDADLQQELIGGAWVGIRSKAAADVPAQVGLRSPAMVEIRTRPNEYITSGCYLKSGSRLFYVTSARDPIDNQMELVLSCDELIGQTASYQPIAGSAITCRVHVTHSAPFLDERGQATDYKTLIQVALFEIGRPQVGDTITIGTDVYTVILYADATDDGVVRGLWVERA